MNLLITNTQEDQAYLILRCLRKEVDRIVVTVCGDNVFQRWKGISAWSRYVSKRCRVPDGSADWRAGIIQSSNTLAEEAYVRRIEEICRAEQIDTVFPSFDPEVYVFAKNKSRLAALGVVVVAPDYEAVIRLLDKSLTLETAEKAGFPVPRSRVIGNSPQLLEAAGNLNPPWVLKPRCNAHGANIVLARSRGELEKCFNSLSAIQERPLLQEYIPSRSKRNYYAVVNRDLTVVSIFSPRVRRTRKTGLRTPCAAVESTSDVPFETEVRTLLKELGAWGGVTVQCIVDTRDGQPKLMEINPRFGHNLWYRTELGINEPLMLLRIAHGQEPGTQPQFAEGLLLLDPLWDMLYLLGQALDQSISWLRSKFGRCADEDFPYEDESLGELLRSFRLEYFGKTRRITSPLNRGFLSDPMPPLCRICRVIIEAIQRRGSPSP